MGMAVAAALGGTISYLFFEQRTVTTTTVMAAPPERPKENCPYNMARVQGFRHVQPLIYSEPVCESSRFETMRGAISSMVTDLRSSGRITSASVYVRDFQKGEWTWFNGGEEYDPGSLLKVPLLLTWLSMAEEDPGVLKRTYTCEPYDFNVPQNTAFPSKQIQVNVSYTVKQLLEYSIAFSDNRATTILTRNVPSSRYIKTYTDLGLPAPDMHAKSYRMNVRDYSVFMKALFNSTSLGPIYSEMALELMTRADFNRGLKAGLPAEVELAHKFGESGTQDERQLHETGLIYARNHPYVVTVMTRGPNVDSLAEAIASVSRLVYERMREP